ncbi:viral A-type inclusion protein [Teratosphaeria destructans]|uniref:Viral A-type inclusion protein n=1 Tax=Teratosphaeria destructans TaxID=418781 RepID=A0A9W7T275_9PEZI|nr:viral A-type inclusion protein [Teratosphaeria destructans]
MAEHSAQSVDSALDYIMNNPYAPSQVLDALKNAIAASDIIEQGKSLMRAKDIEIEALQERARSSLGLEQIHTVEELFEQLRNQLELKDSRIESLGQALEKEQREASIRDQQQAEISDLHVRINGLNAELEMFRNALHTTQQDVQAKDECLRNGLEQNKALTSEVEASRARIQEMNSLTDSLHKARSEAVKDQQKLLEQGKEIETLRHRLAATKEERIIQQLRELSASNDSLTFKLLEQNKQLNDLVVGGPSKEVKDDGKFQKGLGASMWATRPGPPRAVPRHQRSQEDARQESMQQGDGLDGTSKPASSTPPHQRSQVHGRQDPPPQQRDRSLPRDNHHNEPSNIVAVANPPDYGWPETSRRAAPPQHSRASMQQATPPKTPPQQHYASARWDLDSAGCDRNYHGHPIAPPPPSRSGAAGSARSHLGDVRIGDVSEPDRHDSRYITATPVRYASGRYDSREPDRNDSHETRRYDSRYDASPPRAYISGRHGPHEPARYDSPYDTAPPAEYTSSRHNPQYDIESPDSYVPGSGSRRSSRYFASNAALETRPPLPPPSKRYHGTILEHESYGGPESDGENDGW